MRRSPTPNLHRKRNRKARSAPRYHVQIAPIFWSRKYHDWSNIPPDEKLHRMLKEVEAIRTWLNTRRPRNSVELFFSNKGEVRIATKPEKAEVRVEPLPDLGARAYVEISPMEQP